VSLRNQWQLGDVRSLFVVFKHWHIGTFVTEVGECAWFWSDDQPVQTNADTQESLSFKGIELLGIVLHCIIQNVYSANIELYSLHSTTLHYAVYIVLSCFKQDVHSATLHYTGCS
jgi:hypothetical protein